MRTHLSAVGERQPDEDEQSTILLIEKLLQKPSIDTFPARSGDYCNPVTESA